MLVNDPVDGKVRELMNESKKHRSDLLSLQAQIESSKASLSSLERSDLPSITASASEYGTHPNLFNSGDRSGGEFDVFVNIPIFTGFSQTYNERAVRRQLESQQEQYKKSELDVESDVWNAWNNYQTAKLSWQTAQDQLDSAIHLKEVALGRYKEGVGNVLDTLSAESQYSSALFSQLQARYNLLITRVDLVRAGGLLNLAYAQSQKP